MLEELCQQISHRLGACCTYIISCDLPDPSFEGYRRRWLYEMCSLLGVPTDGPSGALCTQSLGGSPIWCPDLRRLGAKAHDRHIALVVDNSLPTSFGCMCIGRGANLALEGLGNMFGEEGQGLVAVSLSRDVWQLLPGIYERIEALRAPSATSFPDWENLVADFTMRRRRENDAASVVANYLRCHPCIAHVWYPGLLHDSENPGSLDSRNAAAPSMLLGGFGPFVDWRFVAQTKICRYIAGTEDPMDQISRLESFIRRI